MAPRKKTASFAPKEMVLAKMTGFPAWPSFVMPPEMIPGAIMKAKKKTTNMCVIFIPDGDFNWMNEKSLEPLTAEKLSAKISKIPKDKLKARPKSKSGRTTNVVEALVAANNLDFDDFMDELNKNTAASDGDEENEEIDNEEIDENEEGEEELDEEEVVEEETEENGEETEAVVRRRRPARDSKARIDDSVDESIDNSIDQEDESERKKKRLRGERPLQSKRARNGHEAAINGDLAKLENDVKNGKDDPARSKNESPRAMSEKDRQHQLWLCRIKLQRSLIQRNQPVTPKDPKSFPAPTVDELSVARIILHRLADFPVSVELLKETKIHKVLRCILKYDDLEYPDSFRLHEKCEELLDKWSDLIESLKQEKQNRSRVGSSAPEDSEVSALEVKKDFEKVEV